MNLKKSFGKNLQKYRKLRKMTQEKLAEKVGIDATSISSMETGKFFPTADNLQKIANALDIKIETLFFFEDESSKDEILNEIIGIVKDLKFDDTKLKAARNFLRSIA